MLGSNDPLARFTLAALAALWLLAAPSAHAAEEDKAIITLRIEAGRHDRNQTPVRALLKSHTLLSTSLLRSLGKAHELPDYPSSKSYQAVDERGGQHTVQLTLKPFEAGISGQRIFEDFEVYLVIPHLPAGQHTTWKIDLRKTGQEQPAFSWHNFEDKFVELRLGDRPVARYMCEALDESTPERREQTYKVYHHLFDPAGKRLVTKGPGGLYTHHRGLFYGFNRINFGGRMEDAWHCTNGVSQRVDGPPLPEEWMAGHLAAQHEDVIDWNRRPPVADEPPEMFREFRELTFFNVPGGTLLEFRSSLEEAGVAHNIRDAIELDGDPQHAGFHFRAAQEVADKTKHLTYFLRPDGRGKPGETRNWPDDPKHVNLPWNAMSFVLGDQRYTVAYLDHPSNPKEARFSERDYGRFGSYFAHTLELEDTLDLRYRIWLQEGEMTVDQVARLSRDFVEPPQVSVVEPRED
ncbi:MAG: DUF6807 family protein [Pirellulales bacterium]